MTNNALNDFCVCVCVFFSLCCVATTKKAFFFFSFDFLLHTQKNKAHNTHKKNKKSSQGGNKNVNEKLEKYLQYYEKPSSDSKNEERKAFVKAKYVQQIYANPRSSSDREEAAKRLAHYFLLVYKLFFLFFFFSLCDSFLFVFCVCVCLCVCS